MHSSTFFLIADLDILMQQDKIKCETVGRHLRHDDFNQGNGSFPDFLVDILSIENRVLLNDRQQILLSPKAMSFYTSAKIKKMCPRSVI